MYSASMHAGVREVCRGDGERSADNGRADRSEDARTRVGPTSRSAEAKPHSTPSPASSQPDSEEVWMVDGVYG